MANYQINLPERLAGVTLLVRRPKRSYFRLLFFERSDYRAPAQGPACLHTNRSARQFQSAPIIVAYKGTKGKPIEP